MLNTLAKLAFAGLDAVGQILSPGARQTFGSWRNCPYWLSDGWPSWWWFNGLINMFIPILIIALLVAILVGIVRWIFRMTTPRRE